MPSLRAILRTTAAVVASIVVAGPALITTASADPAAPSPTRIVPTRDVIGGDVALAPDGTAYWLTDPYRTVSVVALAPGGEPAIVGALPPIAADTPPEHITAYDLSADDGRLAIRRTVTVCSQVDPSCLSESYTSASELIVGPPDALKVVAGCGPNTADVDCVSGPTCPRVSTVVAGPAVVAAAISSCHDPFPSLPATTVVPATGSPVSIPQTGYPRGIAGSLLLSAHEDRSDPSRPFTDLTLRDWTTGQLLWELPADDASFGAAMGPDGTVVYAGFSRTGGTGRLALIPPGQPPSAARTIASAGYGSLLFGFTRNRVLMTGHDLHSARVLSVASGAATTARLAPHPTLVAFGGTTLAYRVTPCQDEWLVLQDVDGPPPPQLLRTCPTPVPRSTLRVTAGAATLTVGCPADPYLGCPGSADVRLYGRRASRVLSGRPGYFAARGESVTLRFRLSRADRRFIAAEHPRRARLRLSASAVEGSKLAPLTRIATIRVAR
jgi:hypothetical protein